MQISRSPIALAQVLTLSGIACMVVFLITSCAPSENSGLYADISAGSRHTCALRGDGSLVCWGSNQSAIGGMELGQSRPPEGMDYSQVTSGVDFSCALLWESGRVVCWGSNDHERAMAPDVVFSQIDVGAQHGCGVRADGLAQCWGSDTHGRAEPPHEDSFTMVSAGAFFSCGVLADKRLHCWGYGAEGATEPPEGEFLSVSAGGRHACALSVSGEALCWGDNAYSQSTPPEGVFVDVTAGERHSCGVKEGEGQVVCWGDNEGPFHGYYGQAMPPEDNLGFVKVSAGVVGFHTCGLKEDGAVVCWGNNDSGQSTPPGDDDPDDPDDEYDDMMGDGFPQ